MLSSPRNELCRCGDGFKPTPSGWVREGGALLSAPELTPSYLWETKHSPGGPPTGRGPGTVESMPGLSYPSPACSSFFITVLSRGLLECPLPTPEATAGSRLDPSPPPLSSQGDWEGPVSIDPIQSNQSNNKKGGEMGCNNGWQMGGVPGVRREAAGWIPAELRPPPHPPASFISHPLVLSLLKLAETSFHSVQDSSSTSKVRVALGGIVGAGGPLNGGPLKKKCPVVQKKTNNTCA